ncbi:ThiF family adenylyltransferase [Mesotoga prima]|uniref:HesA/MoeB/ThiF family protein n=1 Tax=Mesotoga prima TaxID=1184387 RepID=UPI002FDABFD0
MDIENDFLFRWYERQLLVEGMTRSFLLRLAEETFGHLWGATEELTAELLIRSGLSGITRDFPRHRILPFYSPLIYRQKETMEFRDGDDFKIEEDCGKRIVSFPHTLSIMFSPLIAGKVFSWLMNGSNEIGPICDLPLDLQRASRKGRVMVVGAGGLGCPLIKILLDNGIDDICIIEPGEIKLNNLHRQILYDYGDVGLSKASVIEKKIAQRYSGVRVKIRKESFDPTLIKTEKPDVVVSCVDNYEARYLINDSCYRNCVPFVDSAVENFGGYAMFRDKRVPCYRCFMGDNRKDTGAQKGILTFVSYFGGMLEAAMVLTFLNTGMCGDDVFWFDLRKGKFESVSFERREGCPVCSSAKR